MIIEESVIKKIAIALAVAVMGLAVSAGYATLEQPTKATAVKLAKKKQTKLGLYVTAEETHELAKI